MTDAVQVTLESWEKSLRAGREQWSEAREEFLSSSSSRVDRVSLAEQQPKTRRRDTEQGGKLPTWLSTLVRGG